MLRAQRIAISVLLSATAGAQPLTNSSAPAHADWLSHQITGMVKSIDNNGARISIQTRTSRLIQVDTSAAVEARRANIAPVGHAVRVQGVFDQNGVFKATLIQREKDALVGWSADR